MNMGESIMLGVNFRNKGQVTIINIIRSIYLGDLLGERGWLKINKPRILYFDRHIWAGRRGRGGGRSDFFYQSSVLKNFLLDHHYSYIFR